MSNPKNVITLLVIFCFILSSCAPLQSAIGNKLFRKGIRGGETPRELARVGMIYFQDKNYKKAIETFQKIRDLHPFSPYTILAELKIADSHYYKKDYDEALAEYEDFEKLHPRNEVVPYVIYQMGMCHFNRRLSIDRDKAATYEALHLFERLVRTYPESKYAAQAKERIKECREVLARHEFYVGKFYFKTKQYEAALGRFGDILREYPDSDLKEEAIKYVQSCQTELGHSTTTEAPIPQALIEDYSEEKPAMEERPAKQLTEKPTTKEEYKIGPWETLARHEFYVGKFYFKTKQYEAALGRFQKILREYPDTKLREEVLEYINKCDTILNKP